MKDIKLYLEEAKKVLEKIPAEQVEGLLNCLAETQKKKGRVFCLGVGGGAAHASHMVNDLRKICAIEAYAPTDNAAELTARINDDGWESSYKNWLAGSYLADKDMVLIFSVGGGDEQKKVSQNLVEALKYAKEKGARIGGIVSDRGGFTSKVADACVLIPASFTGKVTAHTEAFQSLVGHLLVSHPRLQKNEMKWESIK
jgi:D-sedoheptulose 7-phosphate isomerase